MGLALEAGLEKAGGIVTVTGSVQTLITENALIGVISKDPLSEMIEIRNQPAGDTNVPPVVTVPGIKL